MTRKISLALGLAITLLAGGSALAEIPAKVRIATDGESPPYSLSKPDGSVEGLRGRIRQGAVRKDAADMHRSKCRISAA